ncbi:MAG: hypothetical protein U0939_11585 [Pirellulales bacterium]
MRYLPRKRRAGVTLLELILALGLTVILLGAIGMAIRLNLRTLDARRSNVEEVQLARAVLRMISEDIRSTVQYQPQDFSAVEQMMTNAASAQVNEAAAAAAGATGGPGASGGGSSASAGGGAGGGGFVGGGFGGGPGGGGGPGRGGGPGGPGGGPGGGGFGGGGGRGGQQSGGQQGGQQGNQQGGGQQGGGQNTGGQQGNNGGNAGVGSGAGGGRGGPGGGRGNQGGGRGPGGGMGGIGMPLGDVVSGGGSSGATTSGGASTSGAAGGASGAGGAAGEAAATEEIDDGAVPTSAPGLFGNHFQLQIDTSRLPRLEQYQKVMGDGGVTDVPSDTKTVAYFIRAAGDAPVSNGFAPAGTITSLDASRGGLYRRELDRAVTQYANENGQSDSLNQKGELIAPEVVGLEFRYFDGTQWLEQWDSLQTNSLPLAVEILVAIQPGVRWDGTNSMTADVTSVQPRIFRQVVRLAASRPAATGGDGSTSGESSGSGASSGAASGATP